MTPETIFIFAFGFICGVLFTLVTSVIALVALARWTQRGGGNPFAPPRL